MIKDFEEVQAFYDRYAAHFPEPELRYDDGPIGSHYHWPDVLAHIEWHRKATAAWMRQ